MKAVSDFIATVSGTVEEIDGEIDSKPELLNEDPYGEGWLIVVTPTNLDAELKDIMDFNVALEWHKEQTKGS